MRFRGILVACSVILGLVVGLACGGDTDVVMRFRMEGSSMAPTFDNADVIDVLGYGDTSPQRGDVIVFRSPTGVNREFMKRVIGLPGDVIDITPTEGVILNGEAINEPYVHGDTLCLRSCGPWPVPERSYFVMGDNRQNSSDSRQGWFVPAENIIGWVEE